jgi:hypothetical protein
MIGKNATAAVIVAATIGAAALTPATHVRAATKYDGSWSVVVYTSSGPCDQSYRFSGQIVDGAISYSDGSVVVSGRISPRGAAYVRVSSGSNWAVGSGRMSASYGSGTWRGRGPDGYCSGTWQASRT